MVIVPHSQGGTSHQPTLHQHRISVDIDSLRLELLPKHFIYGNDISIGIGSGVQDGRIDADHIESHIRIPFHPPPVYLDDPPGIALRIAVPVHSEIQRHRAPPSVLPDHPFHIGRKRSVLSDHIDIAAVHPAETVIASGRRAAARISAHHRARIPDKKYDFPVIRTPDEGLAGRLPDPRRSCRSIERKAYYKSAKQDSSKDYIQFLQTLSPV